MLSEPSPEAVGEVVAATGCGRRTAKIYLKESGNDVASAIGLYRSHWPEAVQIQRPHSPSTTSTVSNSFHESANNHYAPLGALPFTDRSSVRTLSISAQSPPMDVRSVDGQDPPLCTLSNDEASNYDTPESELEGQAEPPDSSEWNFWLPTIPAPQSFQPGGIDGSAQFSMQDLIGAMQHGATYEQIQAYLGHHSHPNPNTVRSKINDPVQQFHPLFYAVATNNAWIIRLFVKYGGDVNAVYGSPPLPLLAFAVINSKTIEYETTLSVATLLSLGADASVIPPAFYSPFCRDLPETGPSEEELDDLEDSKRQWCRFPDMRAKLAETLNLTQRYHLHRSSRLEKPTERQRQVARRSNSEDLFGIPYFLIGQPAATESLIKNFLHHMLRQHRDPLVLVFAGPSGHGKTELARRLGSLLSLELHVSDCSIVSRESELFGPRKPFVGADEGSPLNNFLARKSGQKCIVFLDEFERASSDIWNALLIPFDRGEYQDRRNLRTVDCSKTIWIIATNALDERIVGYCNKNQEIFDEDDHAGREGHIENLTDILKEEFISQFKPPLTGRITAFIPFLPFSAPETCVGAHKYLLELATELRRPVNTSFGDHEQLLGNIRLKIRLDASVCQVLAKGYDTQLGIRSLRKIVRDKVATELDYEYMSTQDLIYEGRQMEDYVVFISNGKIKIRRVPSNVANN